MAAFDFPNPPNPGQEVTNDATGITYKYDETTQSWSVVASTITDAYATSADLEAEASVRETNDSRHDTALENLAIESSGHEARITLVESTASSAHSMAASAAALASTADGKADAAQETADEALAAAGGGADLSNYATKGDLSIATANLPYRLETDKTMRSADLPDKTIAGEEPVTYHAGGEIQLVDNLGYFHNVTFTGTHGITTLSTASGIQVSAKDLHDRIGVLEEQVQTLASLIPPVDIGNVTIESSADIDGGNAAARQDEMFIMWCENDGETEHGLRYNWSIKRGNGRISGSTTSKTVSAWCSDPAPATVEFQCVISHPAEADATAIATKIVLVADDA